MEAEVFRSGRGTGLITLSAEDRGFEFLEACLIGSVRVWY